MGLHEILHQEILDLGFLEAKQVKGGVRLKADLKGAYRLCLHTRVAARVLMPLVEFPAPNEDALYEGTRSLDWLAHFSPAHSIAIEANLTGSLLRNSHYAALKVKDAIVDQFKEKTGRRPDVDTKYPDIRLNLFVERDKATLSLDLSGTGLHQRGYRLKSGKAPIRENLAAALLYKADWPRIAQEGGVFLDPFCGTGTILIEAYLMAAKIAPGLHRKHWGFLEWRGHDSSAWEELLQEARDRKEEALTEKYQIFGFDEDYWALDQCRQSLDLLGLTGKIHIEKNDLEHFPKPKKGRMGLVCTNPPYGQRLGTAEEVQDLYTALGRRMKENYQGWKLAMILAEPQWAMGMQLRAKKKNKFFNGPIECEFLQFDVEQEYFVTAPPKDHLRPWLTHQASEEALAFANRIKKNQKRLKGFLKGQTVTCYRIYDRDLPEYALAVDVYEEHLVVYEYQAPKTIDPKKAKLRLLDALAVLPEAMGMDPKKMILKTRKSQKGSDQYEKLAEEKNFHQVQEGGLTFLVNFTDYLDVGLFLDHRSIRALIGKKAQGKRFLNLFCYTASATVYAAEGGARSSLSLDLSKTYTKWAQENLKANDLFSREHWIERADCLKWLQEESRQGKEKFDLIFMDPPSFSNSKSMEGVLDIQRDHVKLIRQATKLLAKGGELIFSCNLRGFKLDKAALEDLVVVDLTAETMPLDFKQNGKIHQAYLIQKNS